MYEYKYDGLSRMKTILKHYFFAGGVNGAAKAMYGQKHVTLYTCNSIVALMSLK
jgi:hypothetical protein